MHDPYVDVYNVNEQVWNVQQTEQRTYGNY